ncbi:MAG: 2-enoyl thioester reductase domain-containing protein [Akkermansiaceae bacterium]
MKSRRLIFKKHGNPTEVLQLDDYELPSLKAGEILLENLASPINPADLNYIEGTYGIKPELPATAGIECSSRVLDSRSDQFSEGDLVIPISKVGGWSKHAITTSSNLIKIDPTINHLQAAMLKVNPATAHLLLTGFSTLNPGDWVTLNASNSGVGQCVVQLAANSGIQTICFLRDPSIGAELRALGASHVFQDSQEGFQEARNILGKDKAKLAFNAVGGDSALRLMKLLDSGGTHITYGAMGRKPLTVPNGPLIFGDICIRGLWVTRWIENTDFTSLQKTYDFLAKRVIDGALEQKIDSSFEISNFTNALARLTEKERNGKVVFQF